jgi:hypothetical protein
VELLGKNSKKKQTSLESSAGSSVDFLDLIISIEKHKIVTRTYQKDLNLYQYISPLSNYSPTMVEGIIFSILKSYKTQNMFKQDYLDMKLKVFVLNV